MVGAFGGGIIIMLARLLGACFLACLACVSAVPIDLQPRETAIHDTARSTSRLPSPAPAFPPVLPEPREWTNGTQRLALCAVLRIVPPKPSSPDLEHMIARYRKLIAPRKPSAGSLLKCGEQQLSLLVLVVTNPSAPLAYSTDESYSLFIPPQHGLGPGAAEQLRFIRAHEEARGEQFSDEGGLVAKLWAKTQVGAMRGLETFSQLVTYDYGQRDCEGATQRQAPVAKGGVGAECGRGYVIRNAPWLIIDSPRFQHREVLVDSARHFLPLATLTRGRACWCLRCRPTTTPSTLSPTRWFSTRHSVARRWKLRAGPRA